MANVQLVWAKYWVVLHGIARYNGIYAEYKQLYKADLGYIISQTYNVKHSI